jgi:hypothetical protein
MKTKSYKWNDGAVLKLTRKGNKADAVLVGVGFISNKLVDYNITDSKLACEMRQFIELTNEVAGRKRK